MDFEDSEDSEITTEEEEQPTPLPVNDRELRAAWIENLRSGRFHQGIGKLRTFVDRTGPKESDLHYTYCCFGVLLETLIERGYEKDEKGASLQHRLETEFYPTDSVLATVGVQKQYVFTNHRTGLKDGLAAHNDGLAAYGDPIRRATFADIADMLETQHLPPLEGPPTVADSAHVEKEK